MLPRGDPHAPALERAAPRRVRLAPRPRARADATGPKDARAAAESLGLDPGNHPNVPAVVVVRDVPPDAFPDVVDAFARDADAALRRAGEYAEDLRERFVRTLASVAEQKAAKTTAALLAAQDAVKALAREAAAAAEKTRARRR